EGSEVAAVLAHQEELFGGGVTESTFVLVDGDLAEVEVANAVWAAQRDVADVDGVRSVGGAPQVLSIMTMAAAALDPAGGPLPGGTPAEADPGPGGPAVWTDDGFAADADLDAVYALLRDRVGEQRVARLLAPDNAAAVIQIRTVVGDSGAERVQREIAAAFAPVETAGAVVTVTSEPIIIAEMSDELSAFQLRAIALTLVVVLALLAAYYAVARRQPLLGVIAMIPATVSASLVLGTMWALGIAFNVLTATLTAIAVGIGVPYGVHVVNRFAEAREHADADTAIATTLRSTGAALAGSALTTLGAFVVLTFSGLPPIRSLGLLGGAGIVFALLAAVLVQPGALVAWARRAASRHP
ncbi:MAG: MMPL family transporter, partial [Nitriliruptoraceae bacterium]